MTIKLTKKEQVAADLLMEALDGNLKAQNRLVEAISTSDMPVQLSPTLTRIALNNYAETPIVWTQYAGRETVTSFESHPYYNFVWGDEHVERENEGKQFISGGLAAVAELDEYPVLNFAASEQSLKTAKNGVQIRFSWESLIQTRNFDLLRRTFAEFGKRARRQEDITAAKILAVNGGVNAKYFNTDNANVATGDAAGPLSRASLIAAFEQIAKTKYNGNPVSISGGYALVVPTALVPTAEEIKGTLAISKTETVGTTVTEYQVTNTLAGKFDIVENVYLSDLSGSDTSWYLIPKPGTTPNPSVVNVYLSGHEQPKVAVRKTTTGDPEDGDFLDDSYATKVRHVVSGGFIRPEGTLYSPGV